MNQTDLNDGLIKLKQLVTTIKATKGCQHVYLPQHTVNIYTGWGDLSYFKVTKVFCQYCLEIKEITEEKDNG